MELSKKHEMLTEILEQANNKSHKMHATKITTDYPHENVTVKFISIEVLTKIINGLWD